MSKVLSQAGNSLADVYDVEGSVAGIDQLETRELPIVHEMGGTIFSERLAGRILRPTTGAILQNITFDVVVTDLPDGPFRILDVVVIANNAARTLQVVVSLRSLPIDGFGVVIAQEMPIFTFDSATDVESRVRIEDFGGAAANQRQLLGTPVAKPNLGIGDGQPLTVPELAFRGVTNGFGAGTVIISALIYIAFPSPRGLSSRGLPLPGW